MSDLAARPRWQGRPGRLEVWYATVTDSATGTGLWVHYETVAPTSGEPYSHGWVATFPASGRPRTARFGPDPARVSRDRAWIDCNGTVAGPGRFTGASASANWDLRWSGTESPMWTMPRWAWRRNALPAAQVVAVPRARITGSVAIVGESIGIDGVGAVSHIYGHGNAHRWAWLHADLDASTTLEVVAAVARRPLLRHLPPLVFVQMRRDGRDWPRDPLLAAPLFRARLHDNSWSVRGTVGTRRLTVRVEQPPDACVDLDYTDPDGTTAMCRNTERANAEVCLEHWRGGRRHIQRWSLDSMAHAELGTRPA